MAKSHGSSIKDDRKYEKLREQGMSKEKAARISNAQARSTGAAKASQRKGGKSRSLAEWTRAALYNKAREVGIEGRSHMSKQELVDALRHH